MKASIAHGVRPSSLILGKDSRKPWGRWDIVLAKAYQRFLNELCQQCGLPKYICFAGETEVITKDGTFAIRDLVGPQTLLTRHPDKPDSPRWVQAEIKSFGVQKLMRVELGRGLERKEVFATPEHRWFVKGEIRQVDKVRDWGAVKTVETQALRPGDALTMAYKQAGNRWIISPIGVAAGFAFGDGTIQGEQVRIDLFGEKDRALAPYFSPLQRATTQKLGDAYSGESKTSYWGFPKSWKDLPSLAEGAPYLRSWLAGYVAADGSVSKAGAVSLYCASRETLERVRDIATACGVGTYSVKTYSRKGISGEFSDLSRLSFVTQHLTPEFFVLEEHRRRFESAKLTARKKEPTAWKVLSVSETDRVEEVFCAVVPGTHAFTLKDNILTGNCHSDDNRIQFKVARDECESTKVSERAQSELSKKDHVTHGVRLFGEPFLTEDAEAEGVEFSDFRRPYLMERARKMGLIPEE